MRGPTHRLPGLILTEHRFALPLAYSDPNGERITVFAREVVSPQNETRDLPWLVFFQGGPGIESPRPRESRRIPLPVPSQGRSGDPGGLRRLATFVRC